MWEPRCLTTLWACMACYRDSFTLWKHSGHCCNGHSLVHLSHLGERKYTCWVTVILSCIRSKAGLGHMSCLDCGSRKICSCTLGCSEVTWCAHESLAAVHQPPQTKLLVTANKEDGPLAQIRNCENWTTKRKIRYIFVAMNRKMKSKFWENVKLRKHKIC
jgi:hypothetical protein